MRFFPQLRSKKTGKQVQGQAGEDAALDYLEKQGLTLVTRNFRCKGGELDLVMRDQQALVFIEVRKRSSMEYGGAAASITAAKQRRLVIAAQTYLQQYASAPACRFDAVAIDGTQINWLQNIIEA